MDENTYGTGWATSTRSMTDVEVRCGSCGYEWTYSGNLGYATCSNCNAKVKTPYNPDSENYDPELERAAPGSNGGTNNS